jgi:hypothetical protein
VNSPLCLNIEGKRGRGEGEEDSDGCKKNIKNVKLKLFMSFKAGQNSN